MSTTINAYAVSLELDASSYIDASKLSRSETAMLKRDIAAARSPMEELALAQSRLGKAYTEGAISIEVYNRLLEAKRQKLLGAADAANRAGTANDSLLTTFSKAGNIVAGIGAAFDIVGNAVNFVSDKLEAFAEHSQVLEDANDKAKNLGLSYRELGALSFAVGRVGGTDAAAALEGALKQMMKRGMIEPGESVVDAFKRIADEVAGITDQQDRAKAATEAFGKSGLELVGALQDGSAELESQLSLWSRNKTLSDAQLEGIAQFNDLVEDAGVLLSGLADIYTAELAPAGSMLLESLTGAETVFAGMRDIARDVTDYIVGSVGAATDLYEVYDAIANPFDSDKRTEALDLGTAEKMVTALYEKRFELEASAAEKAAKRDADRIKAMEEGKAENAAKALEDAAKADDDYYKSLIDGNADAWDSFLSERKSKNELVAKSIEQAERVLDQRRKERDKNREQANKGPASLDAGSAELAKFMAEQANAKLSKDTGDTGKPTEEEILEEAVKQSELMQNQAAQNTRIQEKLGELITATRENGFKRIR